MMLSWLGDLPAGKPRGEHVHFFWPTFDQRVAKRAWINSATAPDFITTMARRERELRIDEGPEPREIP